MHSRSPLPAGPASRRLLPILSLAAALCAPCASALADGTPPSIVVQPVPTTVYVGQTATLNVVASGTTPLTYQWRRGSANVSGATLPSLTFTNATTNLTGVYQVIVSNGAGATNSYQVPLNVLDLPTGSLRAGTFATGPNPSLPVYYTARGTETEAGFSIAFDPATLANPRFVPDLPGLPNPGRAAKPAEALPAGVTLSENASKAAAGAYGARLAFGGGYRLPLGESRLGTVVFDLVAGANPFAASLAFTNDPVVPLGPVIDGTNAAVALNDVLPVVVAGAAPKLDFQTGLFLQRLSIANPGANTQAVAFVSVSGLGNDSQGNPIVLRNAQALSITNSETGFALTNLAPAEVRGLVAEFYVSDLATVPTPAYSIDDAAVLVTPNFSSRYLAVERTLYVKNASYPDGAVLVEFPSEAGRFYYVQYAPSLAELNSAAPTMRTANPPIPGTGSRVQWIDAGPPKTESLPADGARFYRVILGR